MEREYVHHMGGSPHGGSAYVDEVLCQFSAQNYARPWFILQDANYNVVGLTDDIGDLRLVYSYDPYGLILDRDEFGPGGPSGLGTNQSGALTLIPETTLGHQGLFFDRFDAPCTSPQLVPTAYLAIPGAPNGPANSGGPRGAYQNRQRTYIPEFARFAQPDPNGGAVVLLADSGWHAGAEPSVGTSPADPEAMYGNGMNLFGYLNANPLTLNDAMGLSWDPFDLVDDYLAEDAGNKAAFMERLVDGFNTTAHIAFQLAQFHPGVAAAVGIYNLASGAGSIWDLAALVPGGGLARAGVSLSRTRSMYAAQNTGRGVTRRGAAGGGGGSAISRLFRGTGPKDTYVYLGSFSPIPFKPVYVGITRQSLQAREAQHRRQPEKGPTFKLKAITKKMHRNHAKAIETLIILNNPQFINRNRSIAPGSSIFNDAMNWASDAVTRLNIPYIY